MGEGSRTFISRVLDRIDATLWSRGFRRWRKPPLVTSAHRHSRTARPNRERHPFDFATASAWYQEPITIEGRLYNYVLYPGSGDTLCIHFSAFFGESGERRPTRAQFSGYFHRLRMFWPASAHSFLFLCDTFGVEENGCYYKGENGDFFVERAIDEIIGSTIERTEVSPERVVTIGSSMGATGALRVGLKHGFAGIIAACPHIDLDLSALNQNRVPHVAAILGTDDVGNPAYFPVTREIRRIAGSLTRLPRLAIQSAQDDYGVHQEQVVPLVELWLERGGAVASDFHPAGGHTTDYATSDYFDRMIRWCLEG